jgi:hypothetical protein
VSGGIVKGGLDHGAEVSFRPAATSCGSFQKVSATRKGDVAAAYARAMALGAPVSLPIVDRLA